MPETDQQPPAADPLRRLLLTRRAHRGQMTKLSQRADDAVAEFTEIDISPDDKEIARQTLKGIVDSIHTKLQFLKELDNKILELTDEADLEVAIIDSDDYIEAQNVNIRRFCEKTVSTQMRAPSAPGIADQSVLNATQLLKRRVNLPKLQLPTFDGTLLKWTTFFEAFQAAVHDDDNLDSIQKFQYLVANLKGEAARTIEGLSLTNANYEEAINLLKKRYGQPHKLISAYMKALWELPKPTESIYCIKKFYDNLETYTRGLRSLGKQEDAYGDLLIPMVFDKLPTTLKRQISRDHGDGAWKLKELMDALNREIQAGEASIPEDSLTGATSMNQASEVTSTLASFHVNANNKGSQYNNYKPRVPPPASPRAPAVCVYCKDSHSAKECTKVIDKQQRHDIVKRASLCLNCLQGTHSVRDCRSKGRCWNCRGKHHTSLCTGERAPLKPDNSSNQDSGKVSVATIKADSGDTHVALTPAGQPSKYGPVLLKTAIGQLSTSDNCAVTVNILLDEGAQRTFITEKTIRDLGHKCHESESINLSTFGAVDAKLQQVDVAIVKLKTNNGMLDLSALVVSKISTPVKNYMDMTLAKYDYLSKLPLACHADKDDFDIDLLIGADYYWQIVGDHIIRGPGPTAVSSSLGYLLSGPTHMNVSTLQTMIYKVQVSTNSSLDEDVNNFWNLETIGIKDEVENKSIQYEDYRDKQLHVIDGKYIASLPWKSDHSPLPTNYHITTRRTRSMVKRLKQDTRTNYHKIMMDYLRRGFIEEISDDDTTRGHYIPHHAVYKDSATTPIRVVYDCSCKSGFKNEQPSLNDCLDTGPKLINDLVQILIRFRLHKVAFVSDIEKAFLNIQLDVSDREFTKFLWLSDPEDPDSPFKVYRFKTVLFGSVSSPFILNAVVKTLMELNSSNITRDLQKNIYVDNIVTGTDTVTEAITYYKKSIDLLCKGGFNLRSWSTNSDDLQKIIVNDNNQEQGISVKVLGIIWNTESDSLTLSPRHSQNLDVHTKRSVVKITSSIFDPLGVASPVLVKAKIFIQKLWQSNLDWDEPMTDALLEEWIMIRDQLYVVSGLVINRCYFTSGVNSDDDCQLHVFTDASTLAYGAVVFIQYRNNASFVMSKTRVKPLKEITLPRLELLAAFIGTKLAQFVLSALSHLKFTQVVLWSDSQIVLYWINSQKKLPQFVENRVQVIRQGPFTNYRYCPTRDNPADLLTRGITCAELVQSKLWYNGPPWLGQNEWPSCDQFNSNSALICSTDLMDTQETSVNVLSCKEDIGINQIIDITRFSCMQKLLRVTCYVMRFVNALKNKSCHNASLQVSVTEMDYALKLWIQAIQSKEYCKELDTMQHKKSTKSSIVRQLDLFIGKDGFIRCGGRLQNARVSFDAKHPILLPRQHHFTKLLVLRSHILTLHGGLTSTITFIRNTYWIPKIRQVVKSVLRSCVTCLKVSGMPYKLPVTPPLPAFRLEESPPFTACGVDFTGALYYETVGPGMTGRSKAYICLFTCAVTRAIHLEVVTDMSAPSFIRAFRRFAARHSTPSHMISDNALTFIVGAEEITDLLKDPNVLGYLVNRNVQWTFIPKRAPWFGGFYERLIGITKTALKKTLGHSLVTLDELCTLVVEIEASVNDRPLTYVSSCDTGEPSPLTPSMLLCGRCITPLPHRCVTLDEISDLDYGVTELQKRVKQLDLLFEQCWSRWRTEYLPSLREAHAAKTRKLGQSTNQVKIGDIVLVHDDVTKRAQWPLAIVTKLNRGKDGMVRSVEISTKNGISNRPISKLYPLEVTLDNEVTVDTPDEQSNDLVSVPDMNIMKPKRNASVKARQIMKQWVDELSK